MAQEPISKDDFMTVAIHLPASNLYDEGFDYALDLMQERGGVNTLFLNAFGARFPLTDVAGVDKLADHGKPLPEPKEPYNMVWFERPEDLLEETGFELLDSTHHPDSKYAGQCVYTDLAQKSRSRGLKVHARILEYALSAIRGWEELREVDYLGNRTALPCWRQPRYREFWAGLGAYLVGQYGLDGFHFGAERNGPLTQALLWSGNTRAGCFCPHCREAAREKGLDVERARRGFAELDRIARDTTSKEPVFLQIWRLFTKFPEMPAWERLWMEGRDQAWACIRDRVHQARRDAKVGWHLWQYTCSLDLFARASLDYGEWAGFSDYVKPCLYQDAAQERFSNVVAPRYENILFRGVDPPLIKEFVHSVLGHRSGVPETPGQRWSAEYVRAHTEIAAQQLATSGRQADLWPGLGVNIPGAARDARDREILEESAFTALEHGATGLVWCREYQEMALESLDAARRGVERFQKIAAY